MLIILFNFLYYQISGSNEGEKVHVNHFFVVRISSSESYLEKMD